LSLFHGLIGLVGSVREGNRRSSGPPRIEILLKDLNATQAAIRAGYSKKTARSIASENLTKPDIQKKLRELIQQQTVRTQIDADKVIKEAGRVALADVRLAFNKDGTIKDIHDIPEDLGRAISGIEVEETYEGKGKDQVWTGYIKKIKFWSKDKQIEVLMKHLGLFREDNKQVGQTLASAVHQALKDKS
ncbi:MAG: terminase small subunit, partial [Planctomycetes bacterium]|nr:terminase small subunit [Planctomycetota bacterium]